MIVQLLGHERETNPDLFDKMFRQRKAVFHDDKQWDVRIVDEVYEIDEYDRDDTVYLLSLNRRRELVGSIRLISTTMPHMMAGPFQSMFPDIGFTSPIIWEATRFGVVGGGEIQPNGVSTAACELLLGTVQFALDNGIAHVTGVYDAAMPRIYRRCGLNNIELGRHRTENHGTVFVGLWEITPTLEASILSATGLGRPDAGLPDVRAA